MLVHNYKLIMKANARVDTADSALIIMFDLLLLCSHVSKGLKITIFIPFTLVESRTTSNNVIKSPILCCLISCNLMCV